MFPALKHRNYKIYLSGQFVSLIGTWMQQLAMSWMVFRLTKSAFWLGVSGFSSQIPMFIFGLFAGVIVDHVDRHKLLIWTQSLSALQAFTLAALTFTGKINLTELILLNFTLGCINCFDITGRQSFVVQMVKNREDLPNAIALNSSVVNLTRLIGPAVAGAAIAAVGEGMCFLLNGMSYIAVLYALFSIKVDKVKRLKFNVNKIFDHIRVGYQSTFSNEAISAVILFVAYISFFGSPYINVFPALAASLPGGGAHSRLHFCGHGTWFSHWCPLSCLSKRSTRSRRNYCIWRSEYGGFFNRPWSGPRASTSAHLCFYEWYGAYASNELYQHHYSNYG